MKLIGLSCVYAISPSLSKAALDATYTATYVRLDPKRTYAVAHTTQVQEIDHFGEGFAAYLTSQSGNPTDISGNFIRPTRFVEQDGSVYIEAEAIALSRDIPVAARWFVDPIVRRVSRDALHNSLTQTVQAVNKYVASRERPVSSRPMQLPALEGPNCCPPVLPALLASGAD